MYREHIPDRLLRQDSYKCKACNAEKSGAEIRYLSGRTFQPPGEDQFINRDGALNVKQLCTECLASLNDHIGSWVTSGPKNQYDHQPITREKPTSSWTCRKGTVI